MSGPRPPVAKTKNNLTITNFVTCEKLSKPITWLYPFVTNLTLHLSIVPLEYGTIKFRGCTIHILLMLVY